MFEIHEDENNKLSLYGRHRINRKQLMSIMWWN